MKTKVIVTFYSSKSDGEIVLVEGCILLTLEQAEEHATKTLGLTLLRHITNKGDITTVAHNYKEGSEDLANLKSAIEDEDEIRWTYYVYSGFVENNGRCPDAVSW